MVCHVEIVRQNAYDFTAIESARVGLVRPYVPLGIVVNATSTSFSCPAVLAFRRASL
jgi:hypothetical protein